MFIRNTDRLSVDYKALYLRRQDSLIEVLLPVAAKDSSPQLPDQLWSPPSPLSKEYRCLFLRV
jgi:hypothetical protein